MDTDTPLKRLHQRVRNHQSVFLSPGDLQKLGIQAFQVDITDDGILQFDPCFFQPYPEKVLQKYPLDPVSMDDWFPKLNYQPDLNEILKRIREIYPEAEDCVEIAQAKYEHEVALMEGSWMERAREMYDHIDWQLYAWRKGRPRNSPLFDLAALKALWR